MQNASKILPLSSKRGDFFQQLDGGQLERVIDTLRVSPHFLVDLIDVLSAEPLDIHIRLGVSAVLEALSGSEEMTTIIPSLNRLTHHEKAYLRSDACYFLGLVNHSDAEMILQFMLLDLDAEVRAAAKEALEMNGMAVMN